MSESSTQLSTVRRRAEARGIVAEALGVSSGDRPVDPDRLMADHPDLMPELEQELAKLRAIENARRVASSATGGRPQRTNRTAPRSASFPGHRLLDEIHRGGQGFVFRAVHEGTGREVAIKVMREGPFAGERDRARFEREIHVLAQLNHPNIVTIHDTGSSESGDYFVMDYIEGKPLDQHVADGALTVRETLELFATICEAVDSAHLRGIIHRDLKPANIRVGPDGTPQILDFGLAKIERHDAQTLATTMTMPGHFVGSLPWASPEQTRGDGGDIDIRTDVYSLGVVLYQLLTGRFPYEVGGSFLDAMENIAHANATPPRLLNRAIKDEAQTIVLRCLQKQPSRRYQSAGDLARDIRRYLAGEPIEAKRDSTLYVVRKTLRRYRWQSAALAAILLLTVGSAITFAVLFDRASDARRAAEYRAHCEELAGNHLDDITIYARIGETGFDPVHLNLGAERAVEALAEHPLAQVFVMEQTASVCSGHSFDDLEAQWRKRALDLRRTIPSTSDAEVAVFTYKLGDALSRAGRYAEAEGTLLSALEMRRHLYGEDHPDVVDALWGLGRVHFSSGDFARAEVRYCEALAIERRTLPDEHPRLMSRINGLAWLLDAKGKPDGYRKSRAFFLENLGRVERHGLEDQGVASSVFTGLGWSYAWAGEHELGYQYTLRTASLVRSRYPESHPSITSCYRDVAQRHKDVGDYETAERLVLYAIDVLKRSQHEESDTLAAMRHELAKVYTDAGRFDEAEPACRTSLEVHRRVFGSDNRYTARPMTHLGRILIGQGRYAEAEVLLREALAIRLRRLPVGNWKTAKTMSLVGAALTGLGQYDEAERHLMAGYPDILEDRGPYHRRTHEAAQRLVDLYVAWGKPIEAEEWRQALPPRPEIDTSYLKTFEEIIGER